jgi:hypothetical protein
MMIEEQNGMRGTLRHRLAIIAASSAYVFLLFGSLDVSACSSSSNPTKIGRDFVVEVFNQRKAVVGLRIELTTDPESDDEESRTVSIVTTDASGWAKFRSVGPGLYYIGIKHPAFAHSEELQVMQYPPKGSPKKITFEWPGWKPLIAQSVSGILNGHVKTARGLGPDLNQPAYSPVGGAKLTLSNTVANDVVDSRTTQESGMFDFESVPAGAYFLRIETPISNSVRWFHPNDGYVPIEVDPSAKVLNFNLFLDNAICGELGYEQRERE